MNDEKKICQDLPSDHEGENEVKKQANEADGRRQSQHAGNTTNTNAHDAANRIEGAQGNEYNMEAVSGTTGRPSQMNSAQRASMHEKYKEMRGKAMD